MYSSGHAGISLALYAPILFALLVFNMYTVAIIGLVIVLFLASTPDADMKFQHNSTVFHSIPLVRRLVPDIKHRGITHSVWFMLAIGVVLAVGGFFLYPMVETVLNVTRPLFTLSMFFFGAFGILAHMMGDYITPTGINIFYPNGQTRVFTVHSSNTFLFSFRPRSEVKGKIRSDGVLTVAASNKANYLANLIGLLCLGVAIAFSAIIAAEILPFEKSVLSFSIAYLGLILLPILLVQWKEVIRYVSPF